MIDISSFDAIEWLSNRLDDRGDGWADLAIIDPPYSSLEKARSVGTTTRLKSWFPVVIDVEDSSQQLAFLYVPRSEDQSRNNIITIAGQDRDLPGRGGSHDQ